METMDMNSTGVNIFIKKGPGIFDPDAAKSFLDQINQDMDGDPRLEADPLMNQIAENAYRLSKEKGLVDYSGCDAFWLVDETEILDGQGITLVEQDTSGCLKETFKNYDELSKKFIDLKEFLGEANYVGRYFKRTGPIEGRNRSFMVEDKSALVLFATESLMLIQFDSFGEKEYKMLSPKYFEDGNYEYYGEVHEEFNDKEAVHQAIEEQLTKGRRNML